MRDAEDVQFVAAPTDPKSGDVEAAAVFNTTPERLFRALTTKEICDWWVRPGAFDTQEPTCGPGAASVYIVSPQAFRMATWTGDGASVGSKSTVGIRGGCAMKRGSVP